MAFKQLSFKRKVFFNLDNIDTKTYQYYNNKNDDVCNRIKEKLQKSEKKTQIERVCSLFLNYIVQKKNIAKLLTTALNNRS